MRSPGIINRMGFETANELNARAVEAIPKPGWTMAPGTSPSVRSVGANSLIIAILSPFLALSSSRVQRVLLAIVVLDIPIQLGRTFFLRPHEADLGAIKGLTISATTLAIAGLYLSWLFRALAARIPQPRVSLHVNLPLLL